MISWNEILLRLALAAVFGGAVGIERERKNWTAGLRTHMMVCVGATLAMLVSAFGFNDVIGRKDVVLDPSRIAAQVISGIGFIGAGTILFLRQEVIRGLTTASGLWTVAAVGLATGGGMYFAATITTIIAIIILSLLKPIEKKFFTRYKYHVLKISAVNDNSMIQNVQAIFEQNNINIVNITMDKNGEVLTLMVRFKNLRNDATVANLLNALQQVPSIQHVTWNNT